MCSMNTIVSERIVRVFLKMPVGNFDVYVNTATKAVPSSNSYRLDNYCYSRCLHAAYQRVGRLSM